MAFESDIIVTGPDSSEIALVAEVRTTSRSLEGSDRQLKNHMAVVGSPVGLLVTPEHLRIYRDRYLPTPSESIVSVGDFDMKDLLRLEKSGNASADALGFERQVQSWLETLAYESGLEGFNPELRRAAQMYIVPALTYGSVRSGHPRRPVTV